MGQSPFSWPSDWSQAWPEGRAIGSGVGGPHGGTGKDKERKGFLRRNQPVALGRVFLELGPHSTKLVVLREGRMAQGLCSLRGEVGEGAFQKKL